MNALERRLNKVETQARLNQPAMTLDEIDAQINAILGKAGLSMEAIGDMRGCVRALEESLIAPGDAESRGARNTLT